MILKVALQADLLLIPKFLSLPRKKQITGFAGRGHDRHGESHYGFSMGRGGKYFGMDQVKLPSTCEQASCSERTWYADHHREKYEAI
ncbi:hypothetical protein [Paenibacillus sp. 1P07SE]|uniref:hypothetical protein n=1 Tax=Paenibacillus sp. 1P07SE TaxID=3132209 RepID=UPI0039A47684